MTYMVQVLRKGIRDPGIQNFLWVHGQPAQETLSQNRQTPKCIEF